MSVISLLSDFGSLYPAQMKGVILGINPRAVVVDIAHDIPPQNIRAGAFALYISVPYFPAKTVHTAVVDPGVGTSRRPLVVEAKEHIFVGPDNGLLIPAARRISEEIRVRWITNNDLFLKASPTFHGRDIFAPVAAHLSTGMAPEQVGEVIRDYEEFDFGKPGVQNDIVRGRIIYVDGFGNLITNIPAKLLKVRFKYGEILEAGGHRLPLVRTYADVSKGVPLMLEGSHGFIEISVNAGSASGLLGFFLDDDIAINRF